MAGFFSNKEWKDSSAHVLLLSEFLRGNSPNHYAHAEHWESVLNENPGKAIQRFLKEGMLVPAELAERMDYKFKVTDLKAMLKERKLRISGRKHELIERLIDNDKNGMIQVTNELEILKCSNRGEQLAKDYLQHEKEKRERTEHDVFDLLVTRNFKKAVQVVTNYEASQIFPRGLGIDWSNYSGDSEVEALQVIFGETPSILDSIDKIRLENLRLAAGMMQLWGTNSAQPWLVEDFETGTHLNKDAAARMLIFYASHLRDMKQYKEAGVKTVRISGVDDTNICAACRKINRIKYKINNVPELPNPQCTSDIGCRCMTVADDF